jgi:hypothetical protein
MLQKLAAFISEHEGGLESFYNQFLLDGVNINEKTNQRELEKSRKRSEQLDIIIKRLFEQNALGAVSDERFATLMLDYEAEQKVLKEKMAQFQSSLNREKENVLYAGHFIKAIAKYKDVTELTEALLHELIEKISIHQAVGMGKARTQRIDIYWRYVGLLPIN